MSTSASASPLETAAKLGELAAHYGNDAHRARVLGFKSRVFLASEAMRSIRPRAWSRRYTGPELDALCAGLFGLAGASGLLVTSALEPELSSDEAYLLRALEHLDALAAELDALVPLDGREGARMVLAAMRARADALLESVRAEG